VSLSVFLVVFFIACEKDDERLVINQSSEEIIAGNDMAEYEFSAMSNFVDAEINQNTEVGRYAGMGNTVLPTCATSSYNDIDRTLTIDFGTEGCICNDGKTRRGKILASFAGEFNAAGATTTIEAEDYYVNDHLYSGVRIVERTSNPG